jgi:hypothetical protein
MKKLLLFIVICLGFHVVPAAAQVKGKVSYTPFMPVTSRNLTDVILDNGVYELPVNYQSHTGEKSNYVLDVKIQNDNVVCIFFGNGGYVHNGYNSSGYTWRGGGIQWSVDWNGNILSGVAIIQLYYDSGGYQLFTVRIE